MPLTDEPLVPDADLAELDEDLSEDEVIEDEIPDEEESDAVLPPDAPS